MQIHYKCRCQANEQTIVVPDRPADTDIEPWMNIVQACIGYHHSVTAPRCAFTAMEYAKIPYDEHAPQIGTPIVKN